MVNDSDDWDADAIQAKLLALQLNSKPERSPADNWDGYAINARLEALLQTAPQYNGAQSDRGITPLDVDPYHPLSDVDSEPPDVTLSQGPLWGRCPPLPSPPSSFQDRPLSPPSSMSPPPADGSYQLTPVSPVSNDDHDPPEEHLSPLGEHNPINESTQQSHLVSKTSEAYLLDPFFWTWAFRELDSLQPKRWIEGMLMDNWLMNLWIMRGRPDIRYLPTSFLLPRQAAEYPDSILAFRTRFNLPTDGPCPLQWVIGFTNVGGEKDGEKQSGGDHYCCMLFMPREKAIHVLGKRHKEASQRKQPSDWESWGGSNIWRNIAILHGWDTAGETVVYEQNWVQNGYDCGAIVCQVIDMIWANGFSFGYQGFWRKPTLPCCHAVRKQMAADIHQSTLSKMAAFNTLVASNQPAALQGLFTANMQESIAQAEYVQQELESNPGLALQELLDALDKAIRTCGPCNGHLSPQAAQQVSQMSNLILNRLKQKPRGEVAADGPNLENEDEEEAAPEEDEAVPEGPEDLELPAAQVNRPYHVKDWSQAVMGRYPRPVSAPDLPPLTTLRGLRISSDNGYDEYETGPTLEALDPIPDTIMLLAEPNLVYLAGQVRNNPWATFRDYGYRIEPDFYQAFHNLPPIMVKEHLMPVGLSAPGEDSIATQKTRAGNNIDLTDLVVMGAQEMIEKANEEGSNSIFLTGKTWEGELVKLDLQKDAITPTSITEAGDVDSVIWLTRYPRFKHAINIFTKPVIRNKPPIYKHNHIYVDLLVPQSEDDRQALGSRAEWYSKTFKLSQIPHIQLGKMGDGAGSVNLLMAFPRMTHKHPYLPRWVNVVPADVQNLLWDKVIIPAMQAVTPQVVHPYVGLERAHLAFKEKGGKGASKASPTFPFRRKEFTALIKEIQAMIDDSPGELDHFGSHFYILEIKGCKAFTKEVVRMDGLKDMMVNVLDNLHEEFSGLDWEYMGKHHLGELFCDVGVTYHPNDDQPLVGLWRLDSLEASFGAGGYLRGDIHHLNTLSLYGGLQAEMSKSRCSRTHIVFRSSYNLAYEVTRQTNNARDLFKEKEVYKLDDNFLWDSEGILKIYKDTAPKKSYGVRDEFRVGYAALQAIADGMDKEVDSMVDSEAILWLPSQVWFEFLRRRLEALLDHHTSLYRRNPSASNYGVMTGLFTYLMQSVLFTPTMVNSYVRESLALLNYKATVDRFGIFFLHDLDMTKDICLPGVLVKDDLDILRKLGVESMHRLRLPPADPPGIDDEEEEAYPIGRTPSWKELNNALKIQPWTIMKRWTWPSALDQYENSEEGSIIHSASKLFQLFTSQIWAALNNSWKSNIVLHAPTTLQAALECWTLDNIHKCLNSYWILPCNSNIHGDIPGPKAPSFASRSGLYFVKPASKKLEGLWESLADAPGYISEYQKQIEELEGDDIDELHGALEILFSHCQCLPNSKFEGASVIWEVRKGDVTLLGNPRFYKLVSVSNSERPHQTRRAPTHTGKVALQEALLQLTGLSKKQARMTLNLKKTLTLAAAAKKKRSARARNRRVPPTRKRKLGSAVNLDGDSNEEDGPSSTDEEENCEVEPTDSNDEDQGVPMDGEDDGQPSDVTLEDVYLDSDADD